MAYDEQCDVARTVAKVDANVCAQKTPGETITYSSEKVPADVAQLQKHLHLLLQLRQMHSTCTALQGKEEHSHTHRVRYCILKSSRCTCTVYHMCTLPSNTLTSH